jgi:predicted nucleic acid-binding protein
VKKAGIPESTVQSTTFVLDSFALLAYLQDEPAASRIEKLLENAKKERCRLLFSLINLGEVLYITERRGGLVKAHDALALIRQLPIEIVPVDEQTVFAAARIKANYTLSYSDAFVVALATQEDGTIVTSDPEFCSITEFVKVE